MRVRFLEAWLVRQMAWLSFDSLVEQLNQDDHE